MDKGKRHTFSWGWLYSLLSQLCVACVSFGVNMFFVNYCILCVLCVHMIDYVFFKVSSLLFLDCTFPFKGIMMGDVAKVKTVDRWSNVVNGPYWIA